MKSIILLIFYLCVILVPANAMAAQQESALLHDLNQKLSLLETKVNRVAATQEQIIKNQAAIDEGLYSLRIWIRRNRGGSAA